MQTTPRRSSGPRALSGPGSSARRAWPALLLALASACDEAVPTADAPEDPAERTTRVLDTEDCPVAAVPDLAAGEAAFEALFACHGLSAAEVSCQAQDHWPLPVVLLDGTRHGRIEIGQPFVQCDYRLPPGTHRIQVAGETVVVEGVGAVRFPLPAVQLPALSVPLDSEWYPPHHCFESTGYPMGVVPDGPFAPNLRALVEARDQVHRCAGVPEGRFGTVCWGPNVTTGERFGRREHYTCRHHAEVWPGRGYAVFDVVTVVPDDSPEARGVYPPLP